MFSKYTAEIHKFHMLRRVLWGNINHSVTMYVLLPCQLNHWRSVKKFGTKFIPAGAHGGYVVVVIVVVVVIIIIIIICGHSPGIY